ncbi:RNA polymerase sigma factor, sigma-70 family protein [Janthinobacterium agaricidamnosum NBRC 102515 = DSM 9628]|uniref:RNA polymerase sigma factor, sigma-70 family protein n=1 Tax=Janthinobacterium agaricidamnosum NBRC 102515 = DSM 9628 TaxID=1349767 RepID=W0V1G1_9BURK|nr:sigma-70 family RNA polymerase sigma factor [Janthinobacterium agaricidamnosum]CDG81716.1 RNA polymerase sigma factor, sigma-70 family protein [Janthinobacterium agaricidamnosum NBRC 102515 = DSM 9628]
MSITNKNYVEEQLKSLLLPGLNGDSAAYRAFLRALSGRLRAFLKRRLLNYPDHVEDVLQETLLAVHNARHTYDTGQPLTAWVYAIAKYKLMDFLYSHARHAALNEPLDDYADVFVGADDQPAQAKRDIGELLQLLPERQSLPIRHVKLEGLSVKETALLTGLSESAVKIGVHRGLRTLARKIQERP